MLAHQAKLLLNLKLIRKDLLRSLMLAHQAKLVLNLKLIRMDRPSKCHHHQKAAHHLSNRIHPHQNMKILQKKATHPNITKMLIQKL